jgi:hypothetical protein
MMRAALTLACLLLLVTGLATAPASAPVRARVPAVSDFEMTAPVRASASRSGRYVSPVLRAKRRFDLVGLRWRSRARPRIALRARKASARWTPWTAVPADPDDAPDHGGRERSPRGFSAPVWTGDADYVQYRLSKRVPGLRLHFVSVPAPSRRALAARRRDATTPGGQPPIQPRSAWGDEDCKPRSGPEYGDVQVAFVHHTVSANDYTQDEVPSIVLSICRYHRNSNGWNDIGYNLLVDRFGTIWEGRAGGIDQPVVGAQAQGYNSHSTGIANIGTRTDEPASDAELNAYAALIRWKLPLHGAPTQGTVTLTSRGGSSNRYRAGTPVTLERISGHRDGDNTSCPGDALYAQLPDLRARVGGVIPGQARTRLELALEPAKIAYPAEATLSGALRQINGDPVAGAPLDVQAYGSSGWRTTWHATTGSDGAFTLKVGARLSHLLRVVYAGDAARLPTTSRSTLLSVLPELKLERSASRKPVGQRVTLSGTVQPSKRSLVLLVERRVGKERRHGTLKLRARAGRFRRSYRFHSTGLFRFQVAFKGDRRNAAASSSAVYVRALPPAPSVNSGGGVSAGTAGRPR